MHTSFTKEDKRTHYALELSAANIGERVSVLGWAQRQRDLGSLIFIDLRDRTGIVQLAFDDSCSEEIFNAAFGVRAEYVIAAVSYTHLDVYKRQHPLSPSSFAIRTATIPRCGSSPTAPPFTCRLPTSLILKRKKSDSAPNSKK